jgi:hypothetical protein
VRARSLSVCSNPSLKCCVAPKWRTAEAAVEQLCACRWHGTNSKSHQLPSTCVMSGRQAARQGLDGGGGAAKRSGIKRPTSHRPAARDEADGKRARPGGGGSGDVGRDGGAQPAQQRFEPRDAPG